MPKRGKWKLSESFAELFEQSQLEAQMRPGSIVKGVVVEIQPDSVVVHAGLKSEGVIPCDQFFNENGELEVTVGDEVEVALDAVEDGFGATRLSREKAKRAKAWQRLEEASEAGEKVTGFISDKVKGGFTVDIESIRAFLPGSLVDVRPVRDTSYLEGKSLEFKVIKVDRRRNNVVVSRRAVVETESSAERDELLESLKEGAVLKGLVKNLTDYGAFIDLGGIDGLLHITDMAWRRVKHPSEIVNIGDEIEVKILKFDRERTRVSLGLKQLGDDPWVDLARRYPERTRLFGKVTNLADYGCFAELEEGVEGLVHVSEMDWTNKNVHPSKMVHLGQEVEVMVLDIDEERRRISLGMKQCTPNPWDEFAASNNKNDRVTGVIKSITDLSWDMVGEDVVRNYTKGQELETVVLAVDAERERISLGVKQLDSDPVSDYMAKHQNGSIVTGTVSLVDVKNVVVRLEEGVEGMIRASEISLEHIDDARTAVKEGDEIEAMFMGLDRKKRSIALSIKAKETKEEATVLEKYGGEREVGTAKLGDILKKQLDGEGES